jgi:hypothetical protein
MTMRWLQSKAGKLSVWMDRGLISNFLFIFIDG